MRQDPEGTWGVASPAPSVTGFTFVPKDSSAYKEKKKLKTTTLEQWFSNFSEHLMWVGLLKSYLEALLKQKLLGPPLGESVLRLEKLCI